MIRSLNKMYNTSYWVSGMRGYTHTSEHKKLENNNNKLKVLSFARSIRRRSYHNTNGTQLDDKFIV